MRQPFQNERIYLRLASVSQAITEGVSEIRDSVNLFDGRVYGVLDPAKYYLITDQYNMTGPRIAVVFTCRAFFSPEECDYQYRLTDEKVMINVGSSIRRKWLSICFLRYVIAGSS